MAVPLLEQTIYEGSTVGIQISFLDETDSPVTPSSASWTLTDIEGNVVNGRSDEAILSLGTSVTIVLSGDDLAIGTPLVGKKRQLLIKAVYDSDLGDDLPFNQAINFDITSLLAV